MRATRPISAVAAAILILAAFRSFPGAAPTRPGDIPLGTNDYRPAPGDACALLTQAQVAAVLGVSVEAGKHLVATNPLYCVWLQPGGSPNTIRKVELTIRTPSELDQAAAKSDVVKAPTSGVGDEAFYVTPRGFGTALDVKKGSTGFEVKVGGKDLPVARKKAMEKTLAGFVVAKL